MWTPSGWEAGLFLSGVAAGGFFIGYITKWAIGDHDLAHRIEIAEAQAETVLWRDKAEEGVEQIRNINKAMCALMIASGFKHYSKELMETSRKREQAKREMNGQGLQSRYGHDKSPDQWFYERYSNAPPTS